MTSHQSSQPRKGVDYTGITVVYLCHDGQGNFLLSKRSAKCSDEQGTWDPGGGGLELHDTIVNTLRKEIREEYGTPVLEYEFLGYRDVHRQLADGTKTHWLAMDFAALVDRAQVKNGEPHKFDAVEWFTWETLPTPMHSQWPEFIKRFGKRLKKIVSNEK